MVAVFFNNTITIMMSSFHPDLIMFGKQESDLNEASLLFQCKGLERVVRIILPKYNTQLQSIKQILAPTILPRHTSNYI